MKAEEICNARDLLEFVRENEGRLQVRVCVGGSGTNARWETKLLAEATPVQWASHVYRFVQEWLKSSKVPGVGGFVHKRTGEPVPSNEAWGREGRLFE
jgi:hypothetical protein